MSTAPEPESSPESDESAQEPEAAADNVDTDRRPDRSATEEIAVDPSRVRRAPRFARFAMLGGLLGFITGFAASPLARYDIPGVALSVTGLGLLLAATFAPIGVLAGCILALLLERRSGRKGPR
ncbi:MAG: hypothetical protein ACK5KU_12025 [Beutenbergiaceae bacterium]